MTERRRVGIRFTSHIPATLLVILCLLPATGKAETWYVSPQGDDDAQGRQASPFRTIQKAAAVMQAGDTCIVMPGAYRGPVRPAHSGAADKPIRFVAGQAGKVEVYGTRVVEGWQKHEGNIYRAPIDWVPDQVFADRKLLTEARFPNASDNPWKPHTITLKRVDKIYAVGDAIEQAKDKWQGAVLWALDDQRGWVAQQYDIIASKPGRLTMEQERGWWPTGGTARCYIFGVLAALDAPGEWCVQDGYIYLRMPEDADPADHTIEGTQTRFAFDLAGRSHIHLEGFTIRCASINFNDASHCVADGIRASHVSFQRRMKGGFNRDRGINPDTEGLGIVLGGSHNTIRNSFIWQGMGDGVSIFGAHNTLQNCEIWNFNTSASDCAPVNITGEGHVVERCTIYNGGRSLLVHRKLRKGRIVHNHMYSSGLMCRDLGMTYTYQTDGEGTEIAYNIIHHNFAGGNGCVGIYLDDMSSNHIVHHNLVYQVNEAIALNPPRSMHNLVLNNTLVGFSASIGMSLRRPQDMTGTRFINNIFTAGIPKLENMPNVTMQNNLHRERDPRFVNPTWDPRKADFSLRAGSPAVDAATPMPPYTDGFAGEAPDLGAFERGKQKWSAGSSLRDRPADLPEEDLSLRRKKHAE